MQRCSPTFSPYQIHHTQKGEDYMASHPIVHVEIPASDTKAAGEFYSRLFDWKLELDPNFDYLQFNAEGGPGGGFVQVGELGGMQYKPDSLLVYVGTDDIDGTLARAESLGGKTIVPKSEIPQVGWFAVLTDPTGNRIGLYSSIGQQG
jgi:predicted enzyme related to lactoylglutathione lyase